MLYQVMNGEKMQGMLSEPYMPFEIPYTIIRGVNDGPTTVITAGIHCAEFVGIQAAVELANEINPKEVNGTIVILPLLNRSGFEHRTMSMVYEDGKNLNRVFPGNPHGTASERLAYGVFENFIRYADAYIDLHSGDGYEKLMEYAYYVVGKNEEAAKAMADCCHTQYNVRSHFTNGGAYIVASSMGIPSVMIERGGMGVHPRTDIDEDKEDVMNILRHNGNLQGEPIRYSKKDIDRVYYRNAPETGLWYPCFEPGDRFAKGAYLGEIRDAFGHILAQVTAEQNGMVLYETYSLNIIKDTPMIAYAVNEADE